MKQERDPILLFAISANIQNVGKRLPLTLGGMKEVTVIINSKRIIILYYLAFSLFVLAISCIKPAFNWDVIAYVASAKAFETADIQKIHSFTYEHVRKVLPPSQFKELVNANDDYCSTMEKDAAAFYEQLPFYRIRLLYVIIVFLLYKAGLDIVFATYFVSGISVFIAIWVILLICMELRLASPYMYALPPLALSYGILPIARLSTPDGLTFLGFMFCAYLFIKKRLEMFLVIPLLVAVRTDMMLFSVPFLLYLIIFVKNRKVLASIALVATLIIYWFVNWYCKNPGWSTVFYFTLIHLQTHPLTAAARLTIKHYLIAFIGGVKQAVLDKSFLVFVVVNVFFGYLSIAKSRYNKIVALVHSEIRILFIFSLLYVITHFLLFPTLWERFFVGQYLIGTIGLFEILSSRMSAISEMLSNSGKNAN
jgi:hypothetical protein